MKTLTLKRVVVTGLGALTPIGNNIAAYQSGLFEGRNGVNSITKFDTAHFKTHFACELKDFKAEDFIEKKELNRMDNYSVYGVIASDEAIANAGIKNILSLDPSRVGVIWGSGIGGLYSFQQEAMGFAENNRVPRFSPFFIPKMIADIAAGIISIRHGFRGPNYATVSACASSTHAIADAFWTIQRGKADIMITGGSEAPITQVAIGGFNAAKALSENNAHYTTACRPFDKTRDGFVMGEGAGCIVLEEYEHAVKRGATIYAEIVGAAASADAYHLTAPHPEGLGAVQVMAEALKDAEMLPTQIDYINVHGTSTPLGDIAELKAIEKVFNEHAYALNISSTKSMTGHLLGAAGAIEAIACILAIQHSTIPPTINHQETDPLIDERFQLTPNQAKRRVVDAALSNTFGFGGHNASIIFRKIT